MNKMCCIKKCKGRAVKYGLDRKTNQRYKCLKCNRTFSDITIEKIKNEKDIRLALHLILAGCHSRNIERELHIEEKIIKRWSKLYFKGVKKLLPINPLLNITTLIGIYEGIEKGRLTKFNRGRRPGIGRY